MSLLLLNLQQNARRLIKFWVIIIVIASYGHFVSLNDLKQIDFETYNVKYKVDKVKY